MTSYLDNDGMIGILCSCHGLVSHGKKHRRINQEKGFPKRKVSINAIEGFVPFVQERLVVIPWSRRKEISPLSHRREFRSNHHDRGLFDDLVHVFVGYGRVV